MGSVLIVGSDPMTRDFSYLPERLKHIGIQHLMAESADLRAEFPRWSDRLKPEFVKSEGLDRQGKNVVPFDDQS